MRREGMKIRLVETGFLETFQIDPNIKLGSWIESLVKHNAMVRFFSRSKHGYSATLMFNDKESLEAFRVDKHQEHPAAKKYELVVEKDAVVLYGTVQVDRVRGINGKNLAKLRTRAKELASKYGVVFHDESWSGT
jgi:hypothetical protein